ncbi:MAG: ADP-ribosylglycohydrolase family protein, partial [Bacteroidota bacterium]
LIDYKLHGYWTPEDRIFDIGMTTSRAIDRLITIIRAKRETSLPYLKELATEQDNGNGALMRIFPLYAYLRHRPLEAWFEPIWQHSALTHGHERSAWCCLLYLRFCHYIVAHGDAFPKALEKARQDTLSVMDNKPKKQEYDALHKLLYADFTTLARTQVQGNGYVVFSLEAVLWSLFNATDYRSAVLNAVNLGQDTDTTACIAGAPAALSYGRESIPRNWLTALARHEEIIGLGERLERI